MARLLTASFLCLGMCSYANAEEVQIQNPTKPLAAAKTPNQVTANGVFDFFKFQPTGQAAFKVTPETIKALEKHLKNGDEIVIDANGALKISKQAPEQVATEFQKKCMPLLVDIFEMDSKTYNVEGVPIFIDKNGKVVRPNNIVFRVTAKTVKIFQEIKEGDEISINKQDEFTHKKNLKPLRSKNEN